MLTSRFVPIWMKRSYAMWRLSSSCVVLVVATFGATACAGSAGPVREAHFEEIFRKSINLADEKIELAGEGTWFRDTRGWEDIKEAFQPGQTLPTLDGVLVLTESRLILAEWADDRYD